VSVIPLTQRHQLDAPLLFVKAWLRFSRGRRAALGTALPQPPPPVDLTQFALWPAQRLRGMSELTATACHRLSTAPASLNVYFRVASGWRALILDRVVSGYINKIQETRDGAYECVIYNGRVYKSLGKHDPHSTQDIDEYDKLYDLDPAWHICSPTPDALHVCAAYPWAACALVFLCGSAHFTANAQKNDSSWTPGKVAGYNLCLRYENGQYGSRVPKTCYGCDNNNNSYDKSYCQLYDCHGQRRFCRCVYGDYRCCHCHVICISGFYFFRRQNPPIDALIARKL
jgi:hypothetical protein